MPYLELKMSPRRSSQTACSTGSRSAPMQARSLSSLGLPVPARQCCCGSSPASRSRHRARSPSTATTWPMWRLSIAASAWPSRISHSSRTLRLRKHRKSAARPRRLERRGQSGRRQGREAPQDRACAGPRAARTVQWPEAAHRPRPCTRLITTILLLDDPLRNVDAKLRFEMRLELPRLLRQAKSTVLYVTQDYKEAMALADRIAVLSGGKFVQVATPADIYRAPATLAVARLFGDPAINLADSDVVVNGSTVSVELAGERVPIDRDYKSLAGRAVTFGVRPEAVDVLNGKGAGLKATVQAVTPLNERTVLLLRTEFRLGMPRLAPLFCRIDIPKADSEVRIAFDPDRDTSVRPCNGRTHRRPEDWPDVLRAQSEPCRQDLWPRRCACGEGCEPHREAGRDHSPSRFIRLRQDIDLAHDRRLRRRDQRHHHDRQEDHPHLAARAARCRHGFRGLFALSAADHRGEYRLRAEGAAACHG